jgi:thiamine biosynthesis protein ThiS
MSQVTVNAIAREVPLPATVLELVRRFGFDPDRVAVEHNGAILTRAQFSATALAAGDRVEIVQFVGGG